MPTPDLKHPASVITLEARHLSRIMPHRYPMALLDRIEAYWPEEHRVLALKHVSLNDPLIQGHFKEQPVFPPALIIEALAQASGLDMHMEHACQRHGLRPEQFMEPHTLPAHLEMPMSVLAESKLRLHRLVFPGSTIQLEAQRILRREQVCFFRVRASVGGEEVAHGELFLAHPPYGPPPTVPHVEGA